MFRFSKIASVYQARWGVILALLATFGMASPVQADIKYIPNEGQWHSKVAYRAQLSYGRFYLEKQGFTYAFLAKSQVQKSHHEKALSGSVDAHALKVRFKGAHDPEFMQEKPVGPKYNFYTSPNPARWQSGLNAYRTIWYKGIYDGIDLEVTSKHSSIKYNFKIGPSGDPGVIKLEYKGADDLYLDDGGNLQIQTSVNEFREMAPKAYQIIDGEKQPVPCNYQLSDGEVRFELPEGYDASYPLIIDPEVIFSTFSGSNADNFGYTAAFDSAGHGYSAGTVFGNNFPTTSGAYDVSWQGGSSTNWGASGSARDVGILKYNDSGTNVKYVTFLGGSGNEDPHSMVVNSEQDLIVFGNTGSNDFPVTNQAYQTNYQGNYDIYVAKLSSDGSSLKASTYVGGNQMDGLNGRQDFDSNRSSLGWNYGDMFRGEVIVDSQDRVLVATTTKSGQSFPVTSNAFQSTYGGGDQDGCTFRLSANLQKLEAATFIGGPADDAAYSVALGQDQSIIVTGGTKSAQLGFPTNGYQSNNKGGAGEGMLVRFTQDFTTVRGATFLGTKKYDQAYLVQTGPDDKVYVTGQTSSNQFPYKKANYRIRNGKQFISKFNKSLDSLLFSTTFGSGLRKNPDLSPSAFLVDTCGKIYFSGWGGGPNFKGNTNDLPVTSDAFDTTTDGADFYIAVFAQNMQALLYSTYYGGGISQEHVDGGTSRFDKSGIIYQSICGGCGGHSDLPTTKNAWSRVNNGTRPNGLGGCNNALLKINLQVEDVFAGFEAPENACIVDSVRFRNKTRLADSFIWYFGDGDTSHARSPAHHYDTPGKYTVQQVAINPFSCDFADTATQVVRVFDKPGASFKTDTGACVNVREFTYTGDFGERFHWRFGDGQGAKGDSIVQHIYEDTGQYVVSCIVDSGSACTDTVTDTISVESVVKANFSKSLDSCSGTVTFQNQSSNASDFIWFFEGQPEKQTGIGTKKHQYDGRDTFHPRLIAEPNRVCADTLTDTVSFDNIFTNFSYAPIDPCEFKFRLRNSKSLDDTVIWQLADTLIHAVDSANIRLPGPGQYQIAMWIKGASPFCQDTSRKTVTVDSLPELNFTANHPTCAPYLAVNADSSRVNTIQWHLSAADSAFDTTYTSLAAQNRLPLPASQPYYQVTAVAEPTSTCPDTVTQKVAVDSLTEADFSLTLDTCQQALITQNQSPDGLQFRWEFGDGNGSTKANPVHTYQKPGNFAVTLFAEDGLCRDTLTELFQVLPIPDAKYTFERDTCSPRVDFQSQGSADHPHAWDFGNGDTSQRVNPVQIYQQPGTRKVSLIVGPADACADTVEKQVNIPDFVEGQVDISSNRCEPQLTLKAFTNRADSIQWQGKVAPFINQANSDSVVADLPKGGIYNVRLIAFNNQCRDTVERQVTANPAIEADFNYEQVPCRPEIVFESLEAKANGHLWKLGDGVQKKDSGRFKHNYEESGSFRVRYVVNPDGPCADTAQKFVELPNNLFQPVEFPNVFTPNGDGTNDRFRIQGLSGCKEYKLFIYNRWGALVFETKASEDLAWNGKDDNEGGDLPSGTYFFKVKGPNFQKEGTITLIRDD